MLSPLAVVEEFNSRIGASDLVGLTEMMTEDHEFVDRSGFAVSGRDEVADAWRRFFAAFPGYRNHFALGLTRGAMVCVAGESVCSDPRLAGPALWSAEIRGGLVAKWCVYDDTAENRNRLGL
jgi:ketosteroid isomerase-like protein